MIVNKYANGGGSSSGVTPEQVQAQIDSALTPYWDSAATESAITEALSGISLDGYYTSAQTDEKIASAVTPVSEHLAEVEQITASAYTELHDDILELSAATEGKADKKILVDFDHTTQAERAAVYAELKALYDGGSGATINKNYDFYKTVNTWQGQKIDYYTFSGDTLVFGQVVSPENTADQVVYAQVMTIDSGGGVNVVTNIVGGGASGETNLNILAAITSQAEYGAISGSVKTGDLIQVQNVDINGDGGEYGLFQADVQEIEDQGVITKEITWNRADSSDSLNWNYKDYPWMTDNEVYPVDLGAGGFLISLAEGGYNGIGFDGDGKAVITHIVPEEDDQTGEVTGMTREDRDILGELDTLDEVVSQALVDLNERVNEKVESQDIKHMVKLTQAEYDQLATKDPETFYIIVNNSL